MKIIKVEDKTHEELMKCGVKGETFDTIISRLVKQAGKQ